MNKLKEKKLNNKGFSLVELIIVIAIMAVLIGVLAPQYMKYVEKSRQSADGTTINEYVDALTVVASDPSITLDVSKSYTISSAAAADAITINADAASILSDVIDTTNPPKLKSAAFKAAAITITLAYDTTDKVWKVTTSGIPTI